MNSEADIIIVGAGLTGLTLAFYLQKEGKKVIVVEKEKRAGGVINTISENGFIYEAGPNTGVLSTPEIATLFMDLDDRCTLETADPKAEKRYILMHGSWNALPSGLLSAINTPLFTFGDKLRILGEPFRPKGTDPDETVADMVIRRLGRSFLDYAVDPFVSGIYAGDPERLVTRYALPKLYALEQNYGSFIRGSVKKAKEIKSEYEKRATKKVFSVKGGLGNLIQALTSKIGEENILTGAQGLSVHSAVNGYSLAFINSAGEGSQLHARTVVTTTGGFTLPSLLPFIPEETLKPITSLEYASIVQVAAGYNTWKGMKPDAFGALVPTREKRDILGILFPSAIFSDRSPGGGALFSLFMGGIKKPQVYKKSDSEITGIALKEISELLGHSGEPDMLRIFRYLHAIPQYEKSSGERLNAIKKIEAQYPGLVLAGNIRDGIGMADRVKQAKNLSRTLTYGNEK